MSKYLEEEPSTLGMGTDLNLWIQYWAWFWKEFDELIRLLSEQVKGSAANDPRFFKQAEEAKHSKLEAEKKLSEAEKKLTNEESKNLGLAEKLKEREEVEKKGRERLEKLIEMEKKLKGEGKDAKRELEAKKAKLKELESKTSSTEHQEPVRRLSRG